MKKNRNRERLLSIVRGGVADDGEFYSISYSIDIRGNITIWGGMEYEREDFLRPDEQVNRVERRLVPIYEYERLFPYTARIFQIERELNKNVSDETLIRLLSEFRKDRPFDGYGYRMGLMIAIQQMTDETFGNVDLSQYRPERDDRQEVLDSLMRQERQDIFNLWGVDCPPDINDSEHYGERLRADRGQVSEWYKREFSRIGGDYSELWIRH